MNLQDFFSYNNFCPICNSVLTKEAQIDILIDNPDIDQNGFSMAGSIRYNYDGKVFNKTDKLGINNSFNAILKTLHNNFPKTFRINKKFKPRIGKTKLSELIQPWFVNSIDTKILRLCSGENHLYYYESNFVFEDDAYNEIDIDQEILDIHNYRIYNFFNKSIGLRTEIGDKSKHKEQYGIDFFSKKLICLPFMPMQKWQTKTNELMKSQIEKYVLLK